MTQFLLNSFVYQPVTGTRWYLWFQMSKLCQHGFLEMLPVILFVKCEQRSVIYRKWSHPPALASDVRAPSSLWRSRFLPAASGTARRRPNSYLPFKVCRDGSPVSPDERVDVRKTAIPSLLWAGQRLLKTFFFSFKLVRTTVLLCNA